MLPVAFQKLLYVSHPPANVFADEEESVSFIVDVFALKVNQVTVVKFHNVPVHVNVHVPLPIVTVRVLLPFELNQFAVTLKLFASKVP